MLRYAFSLFLQTVAVLVCFFTLLSWWVVATIPVENLPAGTPGIILPTRAFHGIALVILCTTAVFFLAGRRLMKRSLLAREHLPD